MTDLGLKQEIRPLRFGRDAITGLTASRPLDVNGTKRQSRRATCTSGAEGKAD